MLSELTTSDLDVTVAVAFLLLLVNAVSVGAAETATGLRNGTFDGRYSRGIALDWADNSGWADVKVKYGEEMEGGRGGSAQKVECLEFQTGAVQFVQGGLAIRKGRSYSARIWMKGDVSSPVEILFRQHGAPYVTYASKAFKVTPQWREYEFTASPAVDDDDVYFMIRFTSTGTLWLDDASLIDVTETVSAKPARRGNLIANGGFEVGIDRWGARIRENDYTYEMTIDAQDLKLRTTDKTAREGTRALEIPVPAHGRVILTSAPFNLNPGREHTLSYWIATEHPRSVRAGVVSGSFDRMTGDFQSVAVARAWRRQEMTFTPQPAQNDTYYFDLEADGEGRIWLEGVQVREKSESDGDVAGQASIGFEREDMPTLYELNADIHMRASVAADASGEYAVHVRSRDYEGNERSLLDETISFGQAGRRTLEFRHPSDRTGYFHLIGTLERNGEVFDSSEMAIGVVHQARAQSERSFFGNHVRFTPVQLQSARKLGVDWLRMHPPQGTKWAVVETEKGRFNFPDEPIRLAKSMGFHILGSLDTTPKWASTAPADDLSSYRAYPPQDIRDWEAYVYETVSHFKGVIDHWEVWNEPDSGGFLKLAGSLADIRKPGVYVELLKSAYLAAKRANPQAVIIGGCPTGQPPERWVRKIFEQGAYDYMDVLSYHYYTDGRPGDALDTPTARHIEAVRNLMREFGKGAEKPIWETESGIGHTASAFRNSPQALAGYAAEPREAAAYVVRNYTHLLTAGVERWFYYHMFIPGQTNRDDEAGFFEWDGSPRPLALAYENLAWFLGGARYSHPVELPGEVQGAAFADSGRDVLIVWKAGWTRAHFVTVDLPAPGTNQRLTIFDLMGNAVSASGPDLRSVNVGMEPLYAVYTSE